MGHTAGTLRPRTSQKSSMDKLCTRSVCVCRNLFPEGSDGECDVFRSVSHLVRRLLKSESNNACVGLVCTQHYICTVKAVAFCSTGIVCSKLNGHV